MAGNCSARIGSLLNVVVALLHASTKQGISPWLGHLSLLNGSTPCGSRHTNADSFS
jgi:hypothetical protein